MFTERIDLYEYFKISKPENAKGILTTFIHGQSEEISLTRKRPAMLVIGGGAYAWVSFREMEPIAIEFFGKGYNAFTLDYSVKPVTYPTQLLEGCMAVAYIRENAEKLGIDSEHIAANGFSAGGHLCGMLATMTKEKVVREYLGKYADMCRPDAVILSYPVVSSGEKSHGGSFINLTGNNPELAKKLSIEDHVDSDSVPAFIWTTVNDTCVPSENSLIIADAYKKANVPFELHMFQNGWHGSALATLETDGTENGHSLNKEIAVWPILADNWLKYRGFEIKNK